MCADEQLRDMCQVHVAGFTVIDMCMSKRIQRSFQQDGIGRTCRKRTAEYWVEAVRQNLIIIEQGYNLKQTGKRSVRLCFTVWH